MKKKRWILIVEDDPEAVESWGRDIREFNRGEGLIEFQATYAKSKKSAIQHLERVRHNCAVLDLRIPTEDDIATDETEAIGNDVIAKLLNEVAIPAVVYSGHVAEVSDLAKDSPIHVIQKKKGGGMESLKWLAAHENLMSAMEEMQSNIARESASLFSRSIWPRYETAVLAHPEELGGIVTRQTATYVAEKLGLPKNSFHPEEFYQIPPLDEKLSTGDLVVISETVEEGAEPNDIVYVVVTPRCNMARDCYPNHIQLALCKLMTHQWEEFKVRFANTKTKKLKSAMDDLRSYATQGHSTATHFLPPCGEKGPWLADFKEIMTVPGCDAETLLESRFAAVAPSFVPNLVQRYAAYLGRIGQPDLDCDALRRLM